MKKTPEAVLAAARVETPLGLATVWAAHPAPGRRWVVLDADASLRVLDTRSKRRSWEPALSGPMTPAGRPLAEVAA
jgi:hypothetical protein